MERESERAGSVPGLAAQNAEKCRWHRHPGRPRALDGLGRGERLEGSMSGTTIRTESNVVSMLDRMMQVESGSPQVGTRPPESGTIVFQDGRQRVFEQAKGGETLGPILDLIRARTSHEVAEGIIRTMGVHAGKPVSHDMPVSHELVVRLHQATVAAFEQRNLEVIERYLGGDPERTMLTELARLDPRLGAELEKYGTEIDVCV